MALSIDQFINEISTSGIMPVADLVLWMSSIPDGDRPRTSEELARELVKQQKLTKFQSEQIYSGQGKSLSLGNYLILDRLGQGGMGVVLKALHRRMERIVALKVMSQAGMKSPDAVQRFHREVKAAAKLNHPNIVVAHDADEANGTHFLVMEYVEGTNLSALVKEHGPFPPRQAIECILQAARGLEYAHSRGIIHRDIKPANLLFVCSSAFRRSEGMIPPEGGTTNVKILDMGLARIDEGADAQAELTTTGAVMGTVDYMAPEQALSAKSADARSDIYSLGITLWYLLTGRVAYEGDSVMAKLLAHRDAAIPSLFGLMVDGRGLMAGQPASGSSLDHQHSTIDQIFRKMVAKRVEDRYQSMTEVIRDLKQFLSGTASPSEVFAAGGGLGNGSTFAEFAKPSPSDDLSGLSPSGTTVGSLRTGIAPSKAEAETLILTEDDRSTDRGTERPLTVNLSDPQRSQTKLLLRASVLGVAVVALLAIWFTNSGMFKSENAPQHPELTLKPKSESTIVSSDLSNDPLPAVAPFDAAQARAHQEAWAKHLGTTVETTNSGGGKMILIPPGEFLMGSSDEQIGAIIKEVEEVNLGKETIDRILKQERPQHRVIQTRPFYLGATEVTIGQFKKFAEATGFQTYAEKNATDDQSRTYLKPGYPVTDDFPISCVCWDEVLAYCRWLSDVEKASYRMPTEAEWEYACRAGTRSQWSWGDDPKLAEKFAWTQANSESRAHPVATKKANPFGLFDMHGNLSELCQDMFDVTWYARSPATNPISHSGTHNNARGGAFAHFAITRSAYRTGYTRGDLHPLLGFRVLREIESPHEQPSTDRLAAEWVIARGGSVMLFGEEKWIAAKNELPPGGFRLIHVRLGPSLTGVEADLVPLRQLNNLVSVGMFLSNVSPLGLGGLESLPTVEEVGLGGERLGDERLAALVRLKSVRRLALNATELTPEQTATLARTMPQLVFLNLNSNRLLNDGALDSLRQLSNLTLLELSGTQVTAVGVAALQKALPNCKIQWDEPQKPSR